MTSLDSPPAPPRLYNVREVALRLGLSKPTVYLLLAAGKLRGLKYAGQIWRVEATELEKFIEEARVAGRPRDA